jgi:hypothetical protein
VVGELLRVLVEKTVAGIGVGDLRILTRFWPKPAASRSVQMPGDVVSLDFDDR